MLVSRLEMAILDHVESTGPHSTVLCIGKSCQDCDYSDNSHLDQTPNRQIVLHIYPRDECVCVEREYQV
jgi:hypothetical protein